MVTYWFKLNMQRRGTPCDVARITHLYQLYTKTSGRVVDGIDSSAVKGVLAFFEWILFEMDEITF